MSYKSEFASNNTDLQSILDAVNALPDASSGAEIVTGTYTNEASDYTTAITIPGLAGKESFCLAFRGGFNVTNWDVSYGQVLHVQKMADESAFYVEASWDDTTGGCVTITSPTWDSATGTLTFNSIPNYKLYAGDWFYIGW